jgi:hemolysin III
MNPFDNELEVLPGDDGAIALARLKSREEIANCLTHAFGAALSVAGLWCLMAAAAARGASARHLVCFAVYGASLALLYGASTLYHAVRAPRWKKLFRSLDHVCIYLLIAGSYTPFMLLGLKGTWGWTFFGIAWGIALAGMALKIFFTGKFPKISTGTYLAMSWMIVLAIKPLAAALPFWGMAWLVAGGISYTLGVVFFMWEKLPYNHAVWHLFTLGGSACHFASAWISLMPPAAA